MVTGRPDARLVTLVSAAACAGLSEGIRLVCLPLAVTASTTDPRWLAAVVTAGYLPLLLGLPISVLVDHVSPRPLFVLANMARCAGYLTLIVVSMSGRAALPVLTGVALLLAVGQVSQEQAIQRLVPVVIATEDLTRANGRLSSLDFALRLLIGPLTGGLLFTVSDIAAFGTAAAAVGGSAIVLTRLRDVARAPADSGTQRASAARLWSGLPSTLRQPTLRAQAAQMACWNFSTGAVLGVLALWARDVLHLGAVGYSLLAAASAAGGIVGALSADRVRRWCGTCRCIRGGILGMTLTAGLIAATTHPWAAGVLLGTHAWFAAMWSVVTTSLRQALVPSSLLGLVQGALQTLGRSPLALGAATSGVLATWWGLRSPLVASACVCCSMLITLVWVSDRQIADDARSLRTTP